MKKSLCTAVLLLTAALPVRAQEAVHYNVAFPDAVHHEARVTMTVAGLPAGDPLEVVMPTASPGRYAIHQFAKNVYGVEAMDGAGRPLEVVRTSPDTWRVAGHGGRVAFAYTVFGDRADGTYMGVDSTHAHFNMPAAFAYGRGLEGRPITITFQPRAGWKIATQLVPTADPNTFQAPDLQYFMDSPTELSDFTLREWKHGDQTIRIALHHQGSAADADRYAAMAEKVVDEAEAVFGEMPAFDYGTYTFLADYLPWVYGDGMEHRNSTILTSTRPLEGDGGLRNLATLAHEFVHAWNMERIRDAALEPFDFERANMSGNLWFGEGFTSYYDGLLLARAGFTPLDAYAAALGGAIDFVVNSPARRFHSPVQMSQLAPFVDAATSIDLTNRGNTFISYYTWGEVIGLGLDMTLRQRYGKTLDDYMRAVWRAHGEPGVPYTRDDLRRMLGEVAGDEAFAREFFARYIEDGQVVDYAALLAPAGLLLRPARPGTAWLGPLPVRFDDGAARVVAPTVIGTPLYEAGVENGDVIVSLDGRKVASDDDVAAVIGAKRPGDTVEIAFEQRGAIKTRSVRLAEDPSLELVTFEKAGRPVTQEVRRYREAWLGPKAR